MTHLAAISWQLQNSPPLSWWWLTATMAVISAMVLWMVLREPVSGKQRTALSLIRLAALGLVFLMLGGWRIARYETNRPDLILVVDNSGSMQFPAGDSGKLASVSRFEQATRTVNDERWLERLRENYKLKMFSLGSELQRIESLGKLEPLANNSALGSGLLEALSRQSGRSTAALIMLSDGIVTDGPSLGTVAESFNAAGVPLWMIGLGSELPPAELVIEEVSGDRKAFVGDEVPISVRVRASSNTQQEVAVRLRDLESGSVLDQNRIQIGPNLKESQVDLIFRAKSSGKNRLEVSVDSIDGETITTNNRRELAVTVRDEAIRVLLIGSTPSYEFRFLKHLLERVTGQGRAGQGVVELTSVLQEADPRYAGQDVSAAALPPVRQSELEHLDVILLCDADTQQLGARMMEQIDLLVREQGIGLIFIAGPQNGLTADPTLSKLLPVETRTAELPVGVQDQPLRLALTQLGRRSSALQLPDNLSWPDLPAVYWAIRTPQVKTGGHLLLEAAPADASDRTDRIPIIISQLVGAGQVWLQLTDESFRWTGGRADRKVHERYWLQTIRMLARRKLTAVDEIPTLQVSGTRFSEGDSVKITFTAAASQSLDHAKLSISRFGDQAQIHSLHRQPYGPDFAAKLHDLPAGDYTVALVDPSLDPPPREVEFQIVESSLEFLEPRAAFSEMQRASRQTGGEFVEAIEAASLIDRLPRGKPVRLKQLPAITIWNHWLVATLLLGLMSIDWLVRRRWGLG